MSSTVTAMQINVLTSAENCEVRKELVRQFGIRAGETTGPKSVFLTGSTQARARFGGGEAPEASADAA